MHKQVAAGSLLLGVLVGCVLAMTAAVSEREPVEWLSQPRFVPIETGAEGWRVIAFGFTACPDVCPTQLAQLAKLKRALPELSVVFVSLDPRDTPASVQQYASAFHPAFIGVAAALPDYGEQLSAMGIRYAVNSNREVAHSVKLSILDPANRIVGTFRPGYTIEALVLALEPAMQLQVTGS